MTTIEAIRLASLVTAIDVLVASGNFRGDDGFGFFNFQRERNVQPGNVRQRGGQYYYPVQRGWW